MLSASLSYLPLSSLYYINMTTACHINVVLEKNIVKRSFSANTYMRFFISGVKLLAEKIEIILNAP